MFAGQLNIISLNIQFAVLSVLCNTVSGFVCCRKVRRGSTQTPADLSMNWILKDRQPQRWSSPAKCHWRKHKTTVGSRRSPGESVELQHRSREKDEKYSHQIGWFSPLFLKKRQHFLVFYRTYFTIRCSGSFRMIKFPVNFLFRYTNSPGKWNYSTTYRW